MTTDPHRGLVDAGFELTGEAGVATADAELDRVVDVAAQALAVLVDPCHGLEDVGTASLLRQGGIAHVAHALGLADPELRLLDLVASLLHRQVGLLLLGLDSGHLVGQPPLLPIEAILRRQTG